MPNLSEILVSIIIPMYNHWNLIHARLAELYRYAPDYCEIILIDNASEDTDCRTGVAFWQKISRHKIHYERMETNLGFGGGHNYGASLADGEVLIFLSNDVQISGDFVTEIVRELHPGGHKLLGGRTINWDAGWNEIVVKGRNYRLPYLEGWLLAVLKDNWKELGGFDPRYGLCDYEDVDLSVTALSLGYNLIGLNSQHLMHLGGMTANFMDFNRMKHTTENRKLFLEKWNGRFDEILNPKKEDNYG